MKELSYNDILHKNHSEKELETLTNLHLYNQEEIKLISDFNLTN